MRAIAAGVCCFGIVVGCGRADSGTKGAGGESAAQAGAGTGGAAVHAGGAAIGGELEGRAGIGTESGSGGVPDNVGGASIGSSGAGASGAGEGGAGNNPCGAGDFFVKVTGELPGGFGTDQALTLGCSDARPGAFAVPVSFTRPPPESGGIQIGIWACDGDTRALRLDESLAFHDDARMLSLSYAVDRAWRSLDVTVLNISEQPVTDWKAVRSGSSEGVGKIYAGSFTAQGSPAGTPITVTGSFRVCHVANLDTP